MIATSSVLTFEMKLIPSGRFVWFVMLVFECAAGGVDDNERTIKIMIKLIITLNVKAAAKVRTVDKWQDSSLPIKIPLL